MSLALRRAANANPPPAATGARATLAAAIARKSDADRRLAQVLAAHERLDSAAIAGVDAVAAAEVVLAKAKADAPAFLVASALGEAGAAPKSVAEARAELDAAKDALASAREGRALLKPEIERAREAIVWADDAVKEAAAVVLAESPAIGALLDDIEGLQRALAEKAHEVIFLAGKVLHARSGQAPESLSPLAARALALSRRVQTAPQHWEVWREASDVRWRPAFEALQRDANAPLPPGGPSR